jgi:hydroxymethylpyrimidine pyrophosphatase-like HAD family hydrolase
VQAVACHIAASNDDDGVAQVIEQLLDSGDVAG